MSNWNETIQSEEFKALSQQSRIATEHHMRSLLCNQLERMRIGIQETCEDELLEDFEVLEILVTKLLSKD